MQYILSALVAIIIALAPVFNIPLTVVPPKGELPHESEPAPSELSVYDKVVGVDDSVFYISRPNAENMKIVLDKRIFSCYNCNVSQFGEMSERSKEHAWKACIRETVSRVQIPFSP